MEIYTKNRTSIINGKKDEVIRQEALCTFGDYIAMGRHKPGQRLCLVNIDNQGRKSDFESIWIGDATMYHAPSTSDGGIGWDMSHERMSKFVLEVYEF